MGGAPRSSGSVPRASGGVPRASGGARGDVPAAVTGRPAGKIAPSMMCADFLNLEKDIRAFEKLKVEYLHVDVMDGSFVPNYALGTDYVRRLKESTDIPLDVHLMVDRPEDKLAWFCFGEGDIVSFHCEATDHALRAVDRIKGRGARAMLALNPATPLHMLEYVACDLDAVLVMTVNPGFAGQKLAQQALGKIRDLRRAYPEIEIEADGNVSFENAVKMRLAGADIFVAGTSSAFAPGGTLEQNIARLRGCISGEACSGAGGETGSGTGFT